MQPEQGNLVRALQERNLSLNDGKDAMSNFSPFDNTKALSDDAGNPVRYLVDPLAEVYIEPPEAWVSDGMLPPQDLEVREALVELKFATDRLHTFGFVSRMMKSPDYRHALQAAQTKAEALGELVNRSREHKAAIRRIVNAMPLNNGGREALSAYTK